MNQKGSIPIILVISILALIVLSGIFYYRSIQKSSGIDAATQSDSQMVTNSPLSSFIISRKLNELINFKLPSGWVDASKNSESIFLTSPDYYVGDSGGKEKGKSVSISSEPLKKDETLDSSALTFVWDNISEEEKKSHIKKVMVGGLEGRLAYDNYEGSHQHYLIAIDNYLWRIEANLDKQVSLQTQDKDVNFIIQSISFVK